ncbi:MAG: PorT family protein [Bacteroidales bacterium]|jgi:hypothetical protein|nr:PorT family protein [Bacteroidales bacterium]
MKKIVMAAVIATAMFAAFNANAQSHNDKSFAFGVKVGANLSTFDTMDMKLGFNAGFVAEWRINRLLALSLEPVYSLERSGINYEYSFLAQTVEMDVTLNANFINVPILLKVYPIGGLYVEAGPQFGFCLGGKVKTEVKFNGEVVDNLFGVPVNGEYDLKTSGDDANCNLFELGLGFGLGYDFGHLFVGARYNLGLTPFRSEETIGGVTIPEMKNNNISIHLGLKF